MNSEERAVHVYKDGFLCNLHKRTGLNISEFVRVYRHVIDLLVKPVPYIMISQTATTEED